MNKEKFCGNEEGPKKSADKYIPKLKIHHKLESEFVNFHNEVSSQK
jgi:hypothetical protein